MRIISKRALRRYWEVHRDAERPLRAWHSEARAADWSSPADVKRELRNVSIVANDRLVFNIGGNKYRLIVRVDYDYKIVFIRFIGSHADYDKVDARSV